MLSDMSSEGKKQVVIRKVKMEELDVLHGLAVRTFKEAFEHLNDPADIADYISTDMSLAAFEKQLNNDSSLFFFVEKGDEILGYLKLNRPAAQTDQTVDDAIEVERIYVLSEYQGQKIGERLLKKAIEIAKDESYFRVWLGVWEENAAAIRFYERHGFEVFAKHSFILGKDKQTDLMLKLEL